MTDTILVGDKEVTLTKCFGGCVGEDRKHIHILLDPRSRSFASAADPGVQQKILAVLREDFPGIDVTDYRVLLRNLGLSIMGAQEGATSGICVTVPEDTEKKPSDYLQIKMCAPHAEVSLN